MIDALLGPDNPVSPAFNGSDFAARPPYTNNMITAAATPLGSTALESNFSVNIEVAVRGVNGDLDYLTLDTLTPSRPVVSFGYSLGCVYRMNFTGGSQTVRARMAG